MSLFRLLFTVGVSVSLLACGNGDEDKYQGAPPLSNAQSLKVATAMSKSDKLDRAIAERLSPKENKDQDILDLVELLRPCSAESGGSVDLGEIIKYANLSGENCPVAYSYESKFIVVDNKIQRGEKHYRYSTENEEVLGIIEIRSAELDLQYKIDGSYTLSGNILFDSIGNVSLNDRLTIKDLGNSIEEFTFFRRINIGGFVVEARVVWDIDWSSGTGKLTDQKYVINGKFVSAEEMFVIYKIPFTWFESGKRFIIPKP